MKIYTNLIFLLFSFYFNVLNIVAYGAQDGVDVAECMKTECYGNVPPGVVVLPSISNVIIPVDNRQHTSEQKINTLFCRQGAEDRRAKYILGTLFDGIMEIPFYVEVLNGALKFYHPDDDGINGTSFKVLIQIQQLFARELIKASSPSCPISPEQSSMEAIEPREWAAKWYEIKSFAAQIAGIYEKDLQEILNPQKLRKGVLEMRFLSANPDANSWMFGPLIKTYCKLFKRLPAYLVIKDFFGIRLGQQWAQLLSPVIRINRDFLYNNRLYAGVLQWKPKSALKN